MDSFIQVLEKAGVRCLCAALALSCLSSAATGETSTFEERTARFKLFADCGPMQLTVEKLSEDAKKIGLTEESIQAAAESRLRTARLYNTNALPYLYINVNVVGDGLSVRLEYKASSIGRRNTLA